MEIEQKANKVIRPASIYTLSAEETNQITTELQNVITAGGLTPSNSTLTQVRDAIDNLISGATTGEWQKPADWVDIRSGAVPNSVYFLVGHSADYSLYPKFAVYATVSNSGTYDVFVDGIKQATTASGTLTSLDWQTLALTSGFDTVHPTALRTHIVRVTPTISTNTLTAIRSDIASGLEQGILWAHFNISNAINVSSFIGRSTGANMQYENKLCEAITSVTGEILAIGDLQGFAKGAISLKTVPVLNLINATGEVYMHKSFLGAPIKSITIKNGTMTGHETFESCTNLKEIVTENASFRVLGYFLNGAVALKKLPNMVLDVDAYQSFRSIFSIENTIIDASYAHSLTRIGIFGYSGQKIEGLKGFTVSNQAPFNGSRPQIDIPYTGLNREALINLFNSLPTVTGGQVCRIIGATGANDLTAADLAIATGKGWTITR